VSPQYNLIPTVHGWTISYIYMAGSISTQIKFLPWSIRFIDIVVQFLVHAKTAALAPHAYTKRSHIIVSNYKRITFHLDNSYILMCSDPSFLCDGSGNKTLILMTFNVYFYFLGFY